MPGKIRVFVAHSFEKRIARGEKSSDLKVARWFIDLLKSKEMGFDVATGAKGMPTPVHDKVKAEIADCACLIAIFTKRHYDNSRKCWLPPQFVLCEAAMALGFFHNTPKMIGGFYEEGLDPKDLALITIGGLELVPFRRDRLGKDRAKFVSYLKRIPGMLRPGTYPDITGKWNITVKFMSKRPRIYKERAHITHQFGQLFQGVFTSPNPMDTTETLRQELRGQFLDNHRAAYYYKNANNKFTEIGAGLLELDPGHREARGASVNCGISAKDPTLAVLSLAKLPRARAKPRTHGR